MGKFDEVDYANFIIDLENEEAQEFRTLIMEQASDTAEKLCELECKLQGIMCYLVKREGKAEISTYTETAQDIFNIYYDEQMDELYRLFYLQIKLMDE